MTKKIDDAIDVLVAKIAGGGTVAKPDDAIKFSQAAQNLTNVKLNLLEAERLSKTTAKGAGA